MADREAELVLVRTGTANLASVRAAWRRLGAGTVMAGSAEQVLEANLVMLPGVGAFGAAMAALTQAGLVEALQQRVRLGRPTLAICVGLQLFCQGSEESPGVEGLGVIEAQVERFRGEVRVPQMGWNFVTAPEQASLLESGYAYFANSYRLTSFRNALYRSTGVPSFQAAYSEHGEAFVAAIERGPVLACQFHPELSGDWGQALLERWLKGARAC